MNLIRRIRNRLYVRRCKGCSDLSPHSHHLTRIGHRRFIGRWEG